MAEPGPEAPALFEPDCIAPFEAGPTGDKSLPVRSRKPVKSCHFSKSHAFRQGCHALAQFAGIEVKDQVPLPQDAVRHAKRSLPRCWQCPPSCRPGNQTDFLAFEKTLYAFIPPTNRLTSRRPLSGAFAIMSTRGDGRIARSATRIAGTGVNSDLYL